MKAALAEPEMAGFIFENKKEYRAFMKQMKDQVKKIKPRAKDFAVLFRISSVELLTADGVPVNTKGSQ